MKLDATIAAGPERSAELAAGLERAGYDGVWSAETTHDAFLALATAATATARVTLGTAVATAFTRSPMVTAIAAWDLQRASRGRFVLGLGTQVRAHNVRRFSVACEPPAPRLRELVEALRHIWGAFQGEHRLRFRGRFYRHDLLTPFFDPGPIEWPAPHVYLAAVTPSMYRLAGEVADGVHVHPLHSARYLREVALPALGSRRPRPVLAGSVFVCLPGDERAVREQIAFYASTPTYRPVLDTHGRGELSERLHRLQARGEVAAMAAAVDDELLGEVAVGASSWPEAARRLRERYAGLLDRVGVYRLGFPESAQEAAAIAAAFREAGG
ncbi:MAG TPA: TIGR03617 family F420-dependent LLM class oxidoreductase [Gaiellaceae bacterium]|nr:TIGR03617 family F420-dependent LLM class oxidoreductase [Gaiellaceae bacterium]